MALIKLTNHFSLFFLAVTIALTSYTVIAPSVIISTENISELSKIITYTFNLEHNDFIYKDFVQFSVASPDISLSEWSASIKPKQYYDPLFKNNKQVFTQTFTISVIATTTKTWPASIFIYCSYYQKTEKNIKQIEYELINKNTIPDLAISSLNDTELIPYKPVSTTQKALQPLSIDFLSDHLPSIIISNHTKTVITWIFILLLFFLCIVPPYIFSKKDYGLNKFAELMNITGITSFFILIAYLLYFISWWVKSLYSTIGVTAYLSYLVIFYLKKSAHVSCSNIRTFCNFLAISFLATIIPLFLLIAKLLWP